MKSQSLWRLDSTVRFVIEGPDRNDMDPPVESRPGGADEPMERCVETDGSVKTGWRWGGGEVRNSNLN
ncbi:hypothetical protein EYF80_019641 [Liparis tanakae]|uniref:Uncharacterized protein n=1 Tax=Liparis tanakae TaxID=230148 RepID=A0A4Z2HX78_9TELE|nr:hypothetical protein EYF80_019641 [Liparis tanakae]